MRSKAPLALIEQSIMLLVFAMASALCLRAFVWSDARSKYSERRDRAIIQVQSTAEVLKNCHGDFEKAADIQGGSWDESSWLIWYDEEWEQSEDEGEYYVRVVPEETDEDYLGAARIEAAQANGGPLVSFKVCWQEVEQNE
jgi:hypothetical protein